MTKYIWDKEAKSWVDAAAARKTPDGTIHIIRDGMEAAEHPATGIVTDSKSHFRQMTKASGCIEVGDQRVPMKKTPLPAVGPDIKRVWEEKYG